MTNETAAGGAPAKAAPNRNVWLKNAWRISVTWARKEPAAAEAIILALIAIGIAFQWWHWSNGQIGAVVGIGAALMGMFVRGQVTPLIRPTARGRRLVPGPDEPQEQLMRPRPQR